ncbi:hypothetical protein ACLOJK_025154 [Asimina triloba]
MAHHRHGIPAGYYPSTERNPRQKGTTIQPIGRSRSSNPENNRQAYSPQNPPPRKAQKQKKISKFKLGQLRIFKNETPKPASGHLVNTKRMKQSRGFDAWIITIHRSLRKRKGREEEKHTLAELDDEGRKAIHRWVGAKQVGVVDWGGGRISNSHAHDDHHHIKKLHMKPTHLPLD